MPDDVPLPPSVGFVRFGDLRRTEPVSLHWGFDRGTPIDRYYIETFLAEHAQDVRGTVLEFGDDFYARRFGSGRLNETFVLDVDAANSEATYHEDLALGGGLPTEAFDCVICTQTLQLVYDARAAVAALWRALRPGGVALATMPGITRISMSEWPGSWFWSFTAASAMRVFAEQFNEQNVEVRAFGNVLAATAFLYGLAVEDITPAELDRHDPQFEVSVAVRALKASSP